MPLIPNSLRARLVALLERAGLKQPHAIGEAPTFRRDLQHLVDAIVSGEDRPEIRSAIRKGVSAEQWSAFLSAVLDALHPYDAITVLSQAEVTRPLEGIDEKLLPDRGRYEGGEPRPRSPEKRLRILRRSRLHHV